MTSEGRDRIRAGLVTEEELVRDLAALGVRPGDTLMVHASLRAIGPVDGGADGLLDALDRAVGPEGTLLMVLGAVVDHEWVNQRPESERAALLAGMAPYDPEAAPSLPEVGYLAEAFRRRQGTKVNDNPSGRFGARGAGADALLRNTPWNDYYGPDSPLDRLCRVGGRILRIGASPDTTTALHFAEYLADVPENLDDEHGIVDWAGEDYFALILKAYPKDRCAAGMVGRAPAVLIDAADIVAFGAAWMTANLRSASPSAGRANPALR